MRIIFFFGGIAVMAIGFLIIWKSEWMLSNFGRIAFFDQKMGSEGGSRMGYKLIGLVIIFFGFLAASNMIGGFLEWVLSPLLKYTRNLG